MALEPKTAEPKTVEQPLDVLPRRFGQYQLFDHIGRGGMANIYLARLETQLGGDRLVVVKLIHESFSNDATFATQFIDEAKLCAGLRHGNIAQVVDLGRSPGENQLYMAMEYVEGFDLHQLLRKLAQTKIGLPPEFAFHIVREVLAALDFAHRSTSDAGEVMGIVHRDVSPSNVLLSFEGEVKLCDFGIAKAFARVGELKGDAETEESTDQPERIVGKSAYMSPEQAWGQTLDARSDVFAAGILLWEMCAGRRLYRGTEAEMLELARHASIPRLPDRGLPGQEVLQALIDRALHSDREMRFASAHEMLEALDGYLVGQRLFSSQLRFAAFLTDHFSADVIVHRREKERAARALAMGPAATFRPLFDPDEADDDAIEVASRADMQLPELPSSRESESVETTTSTDALSLHASATIPLGALSESDADEVIRSAATTAQATAVKEDSAPTTEEALPSVTQAVEASAGKPTGARSFAWTLVALGLVAVGVAIWLLQR
jgi:serine/threonine-protein kinase